MAIYIALSLTLLLPLAPSLEAIPRFQFVEGSTSESTLDHLKPFICAWWKRHVFFYILSHSPTSATPPYLRLFHTPLFVRRSPCMLHIRFLSLFHSSTSFHLAFFSVNLMRFAFNAILSYHAKYTLSMSERVRVLKRRKPTQMKLCLMYHKENNYWCWETHSHARAAYIVVFKR